MPRPTPDPPRGPEEAPADTSGDGLAASTDASWRRPESVRRQPDSDLEPVRGEVVLVPGVNDGEVPPEEEDNLRNIFSNYGADNTRRAYRGVLKRYERWCQKKGFTPCPAHANTIKAYLSRLHRKGKAFKTIDQALSAISMAHRTLGLGFDMTGKPVTDGSGGVTIRKVPAVQMLMVTLKKCLPPPKKKEALDVSLLEKTLAQITSQDLRAKRDRAIVLVGFMTACRRSELVKLEFSDLKENDEFVPGVDFTFKGRRKTEQTGTKPHVVFVPWLSQTQEGAHLCACQALNDWAEAAKATSGPIFRPILHGTVGERRLGAKQVERIVKKYAAKAGLDPKSFGGHSLRAGFMTEGLERGISVESLMLQTGQKSIEVARGYMRPTTGAARAKGSPAARMFLPPN